MQRCIQNARYSFSVEEQWIVKGGLFSQNLHHRYLIESEYTNAQTEPIIES